MKLHKRKLGFILLEVFIALTLLSISIIPITSYPYKVFTKEKSKLQEIELKRLDSLIFATFIQKLPELLTWDALTKEEIHLDFDIYEIDLKELGSFPYRVELAISTQKQKPSHKLLECRISFFPLIKKSYKPKSIAHLLLVNNLPPPKSLKNTKSPQKS